MVKDAVAYEVEEATQTEHTTALTRQAAEAAWDKKALGLKALDMRGLVTYADYLIICSGNTDRQVRAITDSIERTLRDVGSRPLGVEGREAGRWVLMDYGDLVIHVFTEAERDVYGLDSLWIDAPGLDIQGPPELERPIYY